MRNRELYTITLDKKNIEKLEALREKTGAPVGKIIERYLAAGGF